MLQALVMIQVIVVAECFPASRVLTDGRLLNSSIIPVTGGFIPVQIGHWSWTTCSWQAKILICICPLKKYENSQNTFKEYTSIIAEKSNKNFMNKSAPAISVPAQGFMPDMEYIFHSIYIPIHWPNYYNFGISRGGWGKFDMILYI